MYNKSNNFTQPRDNKPNNFSKSRDNKKRESPLPIQPLPLPKNYLQSAEEIMEKENRPQITTSKIRRLYSLTIEIYDKERLRTEPDLLDSSVSAIGMMRVRMAYEAGRDDNVKTFVQDTKLLEYLKGIGTSRENFLHFCQYMEALVAYHKYFGGKEN